MYKAFAPLYISDTSFRVSGQTKRNRGILFGGSGGGGGGTQPRAILTKRSREFAIRGISKRIATPSVGISGHPIGVISKSMSTTVNTVMVVPVSHRRRWERVRDTREENRNSLGSSCWLVEKDTLWRRETFLLSFLEARTRRGMLLIYPDVYVAFSNIHIVKFSRNLALERRTESPYNFNGRRLYYHPFVCCTIVIYLTCTLIFSIEFFTLRWKDFNLLQILSMLNIRSA